MAIKIIFQWQNTDATADLNQRLASLMEKGVYYGGDLVPVGAGSLNAVRQPFFAIGRDGVTIVDTDTYVVTYQASIKQYHCILAKYNPLGTPSTPSIDELILTEAEYNAHPENSYLIVLATVTPSATEVTYSHIDYSVRDSVGPYGHKWFKGIVENETDLPTGTPNFNKVGDVYVVENDPPIFGFGIYTWTGSAWRLIAANGASTLDGAYDDNGATPGAGRWIYADRGAVEIIQNTTSQRVRDLANAALRLDKSGSTTYGDTALDIQTKSDYDIGSILVRNLFTSGTDVQANEPASLVSPNTLNGTRVGAAWDQPRKFEMCLVEVTGSGNSQDGLYLSSVTGASQVQIKTLDGATPSFVAEGGLTLNFYYPRLSVGSPHSFPICFGDHPWPVGSIEFPGTRVVDTVSGSGKTIFMDPAAHAYAIEFRQLGGSGTSSNQKAYIGSYGQIGAGLTATEAAHSILATHSNASYRAIYGVHSGVGGTAINGFSINGCGVVGESFGTYEGVKGTSVSGIGVYGLATLTTSPAVKGKSEILDGVGVLGEHVTGSFDKGWGVVGWNNTPSTDTAGVDGFAFGNSPGVRGGSVGGIGVLGEIDITNLFGFGVKGIAYWLGGVRGESTAGPGVSGEGGAAGVYGYHASTGPGVVGESDSGVGVSGTDFGYYPQTGMWGVYRVPMSEMEPDNPTNWRLERIASNELYWELQSASGLLRWQWSDYPDGVKVIGVSLNLFINGATTVPLTVYKRNITMTKDATSGSYQLSAEPTATTCINHSAVYGSSGTYNQNYGPTSTPAFTAVNLQQGTTQNAALPNIEINPLQMTIGFNLANCRLYNVYLTLKILGATRWRGPTVS